MITAARVGTEEIGTRVGVGMAAKIGTRAGVGMAAKIGTRGGVGMAAKIGTRVGVGMAGKIGTRVGVGMAAVAGMALQAGTTTADISVGTSTDGAVPGGADPSPWPTAGAGPGLSAPVRAGGIGATRGGGAALAGDGAPVHGLGVACWLVPRSA
jgi:hypothetical protein